MKKRKANKYECSSIEELRRAFDDIKSCVAGDTRFMAQALLFLAEHAVSQKPVQKPGPKRKPSEWQRFLGDAMRQGKTIQEAAAEWRRKKLKAVS